MLSKESLSEHKSRRWSSDRRNRHESAGFQASVLGKLLHGGRGTHPLQVLRLQQLAPKPIHSHLVALQLKPRLCVCVCVCVSWLCILAGLCSPRIRRLTVESGQVRCCSGHSSSCVHRTHVSTITFHLSPRSSTSVPSRPFISAWRWHLHEHSYGQRWCKSCRHHGHLANRHGLRGVKSWSHEAEVRARL